MSYLTKITKLRDQVDVIWITLENKQLVSIALNGLVASQRPFVQGVCARDNFSYFTKLLDDLI